LGWPERAPFNAIIAAAGGPKVPDTWRQQLAVGGRLVMPLGESRNRQRLVRITRRGPSSFEQEDLNEVMFVPLIGKHGWQDKQTGIDRPEQQPQKQPSPPLIVVAACRPLPDPADPAFGAAFDRYGARRVVLLGEASHGTSEFYRARAAITQRLVERHDFDIIAVEADWPDARAVDRHVRQLSGIAPTSQPFRRFPPWMWRNTDVEAFVEWLHRYNSSRSPARRAGFFGLDIYSLSDSIAAVLAFLEQKDPEAARVARERYGCLTPWQQDPAVYGRAVLSSRYRECEEAVVAQLRDLLEQRLHYDGQGDEGFFDAAQNARLVAAAERYYRVMYYGAAESWNLRDRHMFETLCRLLEHRGAGSKAIIWAHNSHIGDARYTDMGRVRDEVNLGQLCRERFGDDAAMIGFGTHAGTVAAASDWDGPMEVKQVLPSRPDSVERLFRDSGLGRGMLAFDDTGPDVQRARELLEMWRLQRFIGVIYRPDTELQSHYAETALARQFDAYVWFKRTSAVQPLPTARRSGVADTWPFGL
jgi:erythromycin esterase-like protein